MIVMHRLLGTTGWQELPEGTEVGFISAGDELRVTMRDGKLQIRNVGIGYKMGLSVQPEACNTITVEAVKP